MDSDRDTLTGGLPHSEIPGSTIARISPGLIAACHALHRLSVPRHPPDALTLLDHAAYRVAISGSSAKPATHRDKPPSDARRRTTAANHMRDAFAHEDTLLPLKT